jgi:hypothetical protein
LCFHTRLYNAVGDRIEDGIGGALEITQHDDVVAGSGDLEDRGAGAGAGAFVADGPFFSNRTTPENSSAAVRSESQRCTSSRFRGGGIFMGRTIARGVTDANFSKTR